MMNIEEFKNSANSQTVTDKECIGILLDKGNIVSIGYTVRNDNYIDKNGNETYRQFLFIEEVDLMEDLNENSEVQSS